MKQRPSSQASWPRPSVRRIWCACCLPQPATGRDTTNNYDWTIYWTGRSQTGHYPKVRVAKEAAGTPFVGDRRAFETSALESRSRTPPGPYGKKEGEVSVVIRYGPPPAVRTVSFEEGDPGHGECLGIVVEDRGSGMAPEILERAFDPTSSAPNSPDEGSAFCRAWYCPGLFRQVVARNGGRPRNMRGGVAAGSERIEGLRAVSWDKLG